MTDGPHKSLPLLKPWKDVAERAANRNYNLEQVAEALPAALVHELRGAPTEAVRQILNEGMDSLFPPELQMRINRLEALRVDHSGNASATAFIDGAIVELALGHSGDEAFKNAALAAAQDRWQSCERAIEEHYYREVSGQKALDMRQRLKDARTHCDLPSLVEELAAKGKLDPRAVRPRPMSDLDQGPEL